MTERSHRDEWPSSRIRKVLNNQRVENRTREVAYKTDMNARLRAAEERIEELRKVEEAARAWNATADGDDVDAHAASCFALEAALASTDPKGDQMTTFDESIAQAVAEYRSKEALLDVAYGALGAANADLTVTRADLAVARTTIIDLEDELDECRNPSPPPPPVLRVPLGLYSGTLQELQARETLLGKINIPSWLFLSMGQLVPAGWNTPRTIIPNIHARVGGTHIKWKDVNSGAYDSQLIATLKSIGTLTQSTVYLSVQEEQDGVEGGTHGSPSDYRAFFSKVQALARTYCPNAKVGQVLANADRLSAWITSGVEWFGFDPHFYGWPAVSFSDRLATIITRMNENGVANVPYSVHVGGVENPNVSFAQHLESILAEGVENPNDPVAQRRLATINAVLRENGVESVPNDPNTKAAYIRAMGAVLLNPPTPRPFLVTYWDRSGVVNGQNADERIDSSPASLAAFREVFA